MTWITYNDRWYYFPQQCALLQTGYAMEMHASSLLTKRDPGLMPKTPATISTATSPQFTVQGKTISSVKSQTPLGYIPSGLGWTTWTVQTETTSGSMALICHTPIGKTVNHLGGLKTALHSGTRVWAGVILTAILILCLMSVARDWTWTKFRTLHEYGMTWDVFSSIILV